MSSVKNLLYLFLLILAGHLACILLNEPGPQYVLKPLLVITLALYFFSRTRHVQVPGRITIGLALFFSWAGDVLLMFDRYGEIYFLLGLSAFLLAHIFYILFYLRVIKKENLAFRFTLLMPVILYYAVLIGWLTPYLGDKKIPVWIYGAVISTMLFLAFCVSFIRYRRAGSLMLAGALLFVLSDSLLAIARFYAAFPFSAFLVMLTYGLAQLLIISGVSGYMEKVNSR